MNNLKTVRFHWKDGETELDLEFIQLEKTWIDGKQLLDEFWDGCVIECNHKYIQTQLILNDIECFVMIFNEDREFISKKPVANSGSPFSLFIPDSIIVLLPVNSELEKMEIEYLAFEEEEYEYEEEFPDIFVLDLSEEDIQRIEESAIPFTEEQIEANEAIIENTLKRLNDENTLKRLSDENTLKRLSVENILKRLSDAGEEH